MNRYSYTIFRTKMGWFGLCGTESGLIRTALPCRTHDEAALYLLKGLDNTANQTAFQALLQEAIQSYFESARVDFSQTPVCLDGFTEFQQQVLRTLHAIPYGRTVTYTDLARLSGRPRAIRAVGSVMAANPLPLIVPCHRVLRADGALGGFSAPGGTETKKRMLQLESQNF